MDLSIVTTLYESASFVGEFYNRMCAAAMSLTPSFEIIFVNDGSPDDSLERALPNPGQSNRIRRDEVVAQDHEDTIGNLAFDESASAGQRTPVESLVERSIHGIAEEHPDIRRLANVLRSPAHELARMTLATELREGEHRPDASDSQHPAMALD